ncbi:MAG: O-antigen ligase family protein, partial [Gemmataceae bacterium]
MSTAPQRSATAVILPSRPNPRAQGLRPENGLGFFLFLLVNIALFVRPADVFPALEGINFYLGLILSCFAVSFLGVLKSFSPQRLERCPIDVFLIALLPIVFLSLASHSRIPEAVDETFSYFKILVYYFLLVTLVSTPSRLRLFLSVLILSTSVMTIMAMLDFFKIISLPRSFLIAGSRFSRIDPNRLYGPGIFHDPNDIAVIIGAATMLLMGKMLDDRGGLFRWLWLFPLGVFGLGFFFTQSRGGLLAFMAGFMTQVILRWGWSRAVFIGAMALPALLVMMAGRMTAISAETETGQSRIQLWEEGILMLKSNPLFGVGQNRYHEEAVQVAHNSYMQQFGDTGLPG